MMLTRRTILTAASGLVLPVFAVPPRPDFAALERHVRGRVGLFAMRGEQLVVHRANERFAYCSVFKWILAAAVLEAVQRGKLTLDRRVPYSEKDLLEPSPVTRARVKEGGLSVDALCAATVTVSDNTAANLLTPLVGGLAGLRRFVQSLGDSVTRFDRLEPELNTNREGDPRDTTTPEAMTRLLHAALTGDVLAEKSRAQLFTWMAATTTGLKRIRASVPSTWSAGDKTGTSGNGAVNDVAVLRPPEGAPIYLSVFVNAPGLAMDDGAAAIAEATKLALAELAPAK